MPSEAFPVTCHLEFLFIMTQNKHKNIASFLLNHSAYNFVMSYCLEEIFSQALLLLILA